MVDATLHVRCRYYRESEGGSSCAAHGHRGPAITSRPEARKRQVDTDRFELLQDLQITEMPLAVERSLPVVAGPNPCATAPCRTADNVRGAACCRDLQVEILCGTEQAELESLVRARRSPYLCKVDRESERSLGVEMISACAYLDGGRGCLLHGRRRPDGSPAKPSLCFDWPDGEVYHPGCAFAK